MANVSGEFDWKDTAKDETVKHDPIDHPEHYNSAGAFCTCGRRIECIDVTRATSFSVGNIIKYLWRHKHKDGIVALKKAQWYLDDLIKHMEREK